MKDRDKKSYKTLAREVASLERKMQKATSAQEKADIEANLFEITASLDFCTLVKIDEYIQAKGLLIKENLKR